MSDIYSTAWWGRAATRGDKAHLFTIARDEGNNVVISVCRRFVPVTYISTTTTGAGAPRCERCKARARFYLVMPTPQFAVNSTLEKILAVEAFRRREKRRR